MPRLLDGYRLDISGDKASDDARITRYKLVKDNAPKTAVYKSDATYRATIDAYIALGATFDTNRDAAEKAKHAASVAEGTLDTSRGALDAAYDVCSLGMLTRAVGVEDIKDGGFAAVAQEPIARDVATPTGLLVRFDPAMSAIKVRATFSDKGKHQIYLEVSPDPIGPATFRRLDTTGVRQILRGFAPGLWWVRVAAFRARDRSEWIGPVSVLVK
jgi:hypothetical protein